MKSTQNITLVQGSGTFLAERAMAASNLKMALNESHTIGHWCRVGPQNLLIRYKFGNSSYMTTEDDTSGNFGRSFWKYPLFCKALKKSAKICLRAREPDAVLKKVTRGSRAIGSRPLL